MVLSTIMRWTLCDQPLLEAYSTFTKSDAATNCVVLTQWWKHKCGWIRLG